MQKELDATAGASARSGREAGGLSRFWGSATESSSMLAKGAGLATVAVGALGSVGFGGLMSYAITSTREVQGYVAGIKSLSANSEEASGVLKSMIDYVQGKPFDRIEVLGAARNLMTFGRTATQTKSDIELLGRASIVSGKDIGSLSEIYGRVASSGRLMNDDFNQLMYAGVNVGKTLSSNLGVSMDELRQRMAEGEVSFQDFRTAMEQALPADAVEQNSNTIDNKLLTLQSSFRNLGFSILGVDFSKVDGNGQPLVKEGGLLDRGIKLIDRLTTLLKDPAIQAGFQLIGDAAAKAAEAGLTAFGWALEKLPGVLGWIKDNAPAVAGGVLGALIPAFIAWGTAAWGAAAGMIAATWPILLLIGLGALLGVAINEVVKHFGGWGTVMEWLRGVGDTLYKFFTETVPAGFTQAFQWISDRATWLKDNFWETVGFIIGFFATLPIKLPVFVFNAIGAIIAWLASIDWGAVFRSIGDAFGRGWDAVKNGAIAVWEWLKKLDWGAIGRGVGNAIIGVLEGAINGALSGLPGNLKVSIPRFATGTNYAPGGMAWVGERGPELVNLPRGSQVYTNSQSRQMTGKAQSRGDIHVEQHIHNQVDYDRGIAELGFMLRAA
ncbi:tape measure protein [Gordonia sp. CNJ-863]|uniref:tape measure protein n=1 Tax=Gordonia sp. CNJ-863 TaxID=1904963 RepID=UPI001300E1B9|nr:tape measure protein [Gordonia sp. CNJ-863]